MHFPKHLRLETTEEQIHILHLICSLWKMPMEENIGLNSQHDLVIFCYYYLSLVSFSPQIWNVESAR